MARICLVVPVQDEQATIGQLLRSVAQQTRLPDEIILVDAGSRDSTRREADAAGIGLPVRVVMEARIYPGQARNRGVAETGAEWIAFTDAGITLDREWLRELETARTDVSDVVLGRYDAVCDTFFQECAALAYVPGLGVDGLRGPSIASSLIRRAAFVRAGGFPPFRAAEDLVFFSRLRATGAVFGAAPRAVVHWQIAPSPFRTFRRFALYSEHNLLAGWARHWQWGIARLYVALAGTLAALLAGIGASPWLGLLLPAFFLVRAARAAWQKRSSFPFSTLQPWRILGAAGVLVLIDAATLDGVMSWLRKGRVRAASQRKGARWQ